MTIETQTLLYHMQKNRLTGMNKEAALKALENEDANLYVEEVRRSLYNELKNMSETEYYAACKEAIINHAEEDKPEEETK